MTAKTKEIVILKRDVMAALVPAGTPIMVQKGTEVTIVQSLGGSFTVNIFGNLARIEEQDADALGREVTSILDTLPKDASAQDKVWAQLRTVYDPEIPVNIVDLGLVYDCALEQVEADAVSRQANITMTLTAPGCGMGPTIVEDVKRKVLAIAEISDVEVELVFDPPWDRERMSDAAKLQLGML